MGIKYIETNLKTQDVADLLITVCQRDEVTLEP